MIFKEGIYYFAHPYTCKDKNGISILQGEEANFNLACVRSNELLKRGYLIYSPIIHSHSMHIKDPEFLKNREYQLWIELDNRTIELTQFKGIILAPSWETSSGCKGEYETFKKKGLEILLYEEVIKEPIIYRE